MTMGPKFGYDKKIELHMNMKLDMIINMKFDIIINIILANQYRHKT